MTWELASAATIAAALVAGFAWYERSNPSSKLLAAVAALAAVAVAGRVVLAPVPNVQATTDVVLLAGYALGAGPGFAVGAVGALVSNFFLGQGAWTPWQMLGWGAIGVGGAALGRLAGRRVPSRWLLVPACAIAGFAFGAWMDLFTLTTFAAERSGDSYLVIATASFPFNVAHAVGNVLLALALGPELVRLLLRYRRRLEVRWHAAGSPMRKLPARNVAAVALVVALAPMASPGDARAAKLGGAVPYLEHAQNADGGFGSAPGQRSSQLITGWTAVGLEAGGRNPLDVRRRGRSVIGFMRRHAGSLDEDGEIERTILALRGAGKSARRFAGRDLVATLARRQRSDGSFAGQVNWTAFGILALRAAGRPAKSRAVQRAAGFVVGEQSPDGGFSFAGASGASDADDTGSVLQALAAAGRARSKAVARALSYLRHHQNDDGGFGQLSGSRSNAQSTAWAVQGIVAAGREPARFRTRGSRSPLGYLASLQQSDGSFRYSRTSTQTPVWVTAQAIAALRRRPLPLEPVRRVRSARHGLRARSARPPARAAAPGRRDRTPQDESASRPARRQLPAGVPPTVISPEPAASVGARERSGSSRRPLVAGAAIAALALAAGGAIARRRLRR
jgi:energy-coupling factor transport system substrate-specific component